MPLLNQEFCGRSQKPHIDSLLGSTHEMENKAR